MTPQEYFPHYYPHFRLRWLTQRNLLLTDGISEAELPEPDEALLLPAVCPTMRPPYIRVSPDSLVPGDVYQAPDGSRWRVLSRRKDIPSPRDRAGFFCGCPTYVYLMERLTGGERGKKAVQYLPAIADVNLADGLRYLIACRRPHPQMHQINFRVYCRFWHEQEQEAA
jgi:hypothetical protein